MTVKTETLEFHWDAIMTEHPGLSFDQVCEEIARRAEANLSDVKVWAQDRVKVARRQAKENIYNQEPDF